MPQQAICSLLRQC